NTLPSKRLKRDLDYVPKNKYTTRHQQSPDTSHKSNGKELTTKKTRNQKNEQTSILTYKVHNTRSREKREKKFIEESSSGKLGIGLKNIGNTCYINAVLHSLLSLNTFVYYVMNKELHDKIVNYTSAFMEGQSNGT